MNPLTAIFSNIQTQFSGIITDGLTVITAIINILIVLFAFRVIYSLISGASVIPEGMIKSSQDREYDQIYEKEYEKERTGLIKDHAKEEIASKYRS
jgi:hypothetical protein